MFSNCSSLEEIDISTFDTNKVVNMRYMFGECKALKEINLSNFIIRNANDMSYMFYECLSLKKIIFPNIETNNNINLEKILYGCKLREIIFNKIFINNINIFQLLLSQSLSLEEIKIYGNGIRKNNLNIK